MTDAGFEEVARGCRKLEELRLYACSGVSDRALAAVGTLARLRVRLVRGSENFCPARLPFDWSGSNVSMPLHV